MVFRQISPQVKYPGKAICRLIWTTSQQILRNIKGWIYCFFEQEVTEETENTTIVLVQGLRSLCLLCLLALKIFCDDPNWQTTDSCDHLEVNSLIPFVIRVSSKSRKTTNSTNFTNSGKSLRDVFCYHKIFPCEATKKTETTEKKYLCCLCYLLFKILQR